MSAARHVCVVTETYAPDINGVAMTLGRLVHGLRARGHLVSVVRPWPGAGAGVPPGEEGQLMLVPGLPVPGYPAVRIGLPAAGRLRARWTARRPDAVYVATEGPLGWSALRAAARLDVPVLSGFHTNFHGYARHYGTGWFAPLAFRYLRWFHNRTRATLVAGGALRDELDRRGIARLRVLGRGVDGDGFAPARRSPALRHRWGAADGDLVAIHVGRLAPEKNLPLLFEAHRAMQRARPGGRLVVVGDGPLRATLERAHPDAIFCGVRTGDDLAAHYASADVFLFPSETETFGNVTLEAMASGLAVVAYDYAAARVHVRHGESGVLAPCGDAARFVAAAAGLAAAPDRLPALRRRAREQAAPVGWAGVVERFEAILLDALDARPGPRPGAPRASGRNGVESTSAGAALAAGGGAWERT